MRTLRIIAVFLAACLGAQAYTITTVTIAVTNASGTTNGQTLTVNSDVRTWTNNVVVPASQVLTNSTQTGAAFNLLSQISLHPFNALQTFQSGPTNVVLRGTNDFTITATVSPGWATVSYVTNTVATAIVYRAPGAVEPAAQQTNLASDIAFQLRTSTNAITLNTGGTNDFGHTILDDPASGSYLQKRASDGVTVGTFDASGYSNVVYQPSTNVNNTGLYTVGQYWETNIVGDITLGAFGGIPADHMWQLWIRGTNSDTSTHRIRFPSGVTGAYGLSTLPYDGYVTNAKAKIFWVLGFGNKATNVFEWPIQ